MRIPALGQSSWTAEYYQQVCLQVPYLHRDNAPVSPLYPRKLLKRQTLSHRSVLTRGRRERVGQPHTDHELPTGHFMGRSREPAELPLFCRRASVSGEWGLEHKPLAPYPSGTCGGKQYPRFPSPGVCHRHEPVLCHRPLHGRIRDVGAHYSVPGTLRCCSPHERRSRPVICRQLCRCADLGFSRCA